MHVYDRGAYSAWRARAPACLCWLHMCMYTSMYLHMYTWISIYNRGAYSASRARTLTCLCLLRCCARISSQLQSVAVCCSVLQCVAVCCSVLRAHIESVAAV